jgi:hypothetical protein
MSSAINAIGGDGTGSGEHDASGFKEECTLSLTNNFFLHQQNEY